MQNRKKWTYIAIKIIIGVGLLTLLAIFIANAHAAFSMSKSIRDYYWNELSSILLSIPLILFAALPYLYFYLRLKKVIEKNTSGIGLLIFSLIVTIFGCVIYIDGFFINTDAQNALILVTLPILQLLLCSVQYLFRNGFKLEK